MPWWAAGLYAGSLRRLLLQLRRNPRGEALAALIRGVAAELPTGTGQTLLVPMVDTPEQAAHVVRAAKYPPEGVRGSAI